MAILTNRANSIGEIGHEDISPVITISLTLIVIVSNGSMFVPVDNQLNRILINLPISMPGKFLSFCEKCFSIELSF